MSHVLFDHVRIQYIYSGYQNFSLQIIDQVENGNVEALVEAELYWQDQLRVFLENGGHAHCRRKDK